MGEEVRRQIQLGITSWVTLQNNSITNSDLSASQTFPVIHLQAALWGWGEKISHFYMTVLPQFLQLQYLSLWW